MVGAFKSLSAVKWLKSIKENNMEFVGSIWQKNYYEHVIRNEKELNQVREYIIYNPLKWELNRENPDHLDDPTYSTGLKWLDEEA